MKIEISSERVSKQIPAENITENYIKVVFEDNGIGFNPQKSEQIFEIFTRLDKHQKGAGIGLAVCRKIMALHQGFIMGESIEGKGSKFCCFFPVM